MEERVINSVRVQGGRGRYHRRRKHPNWFLKDKQRVSSQGKQDGQTPGGCGDFSELHVIQYCWSFKHEEEA